MSRTLILALAVGAVALVGFSTFNGLSSGPIVEAAKVKKGPIQEFVDERAKTRLPQTYVVSMPFDGRVEPIELLEGAAVKKGQVVAKVVPLDLKLQWDAANAAIARLDASIKENDDVSVESVSLEQSLQIVESMHSSVMAAAAQVETARAKLDYNTRNYNRIEALYRTKTKTEDELEQTRLAKIQSEIELRQDELILASLKAVEAATSLGPKAIREYMARKSLARGVLEKQKSEAKISLAQVEKDQSRGEMKSPVDGVVLERMMSDERRVAGGTPLLKIGRLEELEVEADVLSQEVVDAKAGNDVEISGPSIGSTPVHGTVKRIYPAGFTKVSSLGVEQQRVKVIVGLNPSDLERLREERGLGVDYRVSVRIFTRSRSGALTIPRSALFRGAEGKWQVFAVRDGRARLQAVETGLMNDESAEIREGLAEGDTVVLAPETSLADGARVTPKVRETQTAVPPPAVD